MYITVPICSVCRLFHFDVYANLFYLLYIVYTNLRENFLVLIVLYVYTVLITGLIISFKHLN